MRLFDIIRKDVTVVLRDWKALVFIVLMPIVLMTILGLALGGVFSTGGFSLDMIHIAVVDSSVAPDETEIRDAIVQQVMDEAGSENVSPADIQMRAQGFESVDAQQMTIYTVLDSPEVAEFISYEVMDADAAAEKLEAGDISAIVTIPESFAMDMVMGMVTGRSHATVEVTGSTDATISHGIVTSVVNAYTNTVSQISADIGILMQTVGESGAMSQDAMSKIDIEGMIMQGVSETADGVADIQSKGVTARKTLDSFAYYAIAITCMFVLYSAGQGSTFMYTENQEKTLVRLRAAGISKTKLLMGKAIAVFALTVFQLIVLFAFSTLAFGLVWGSVWQLILISLCVALSVTGLGVLLMVLVFRADNPRLGNAFQSIIVQVLALFGGSYLPLSQLPEFFSSISLATPNGLAIHAYTGSMSGAPFVEILPYIAGSVGVGIVLFILGISLFPRERRA